MTDRTVGHFDFQPNGPAVPQVAIVQPAVVPTPRRVQQDFAVEVKHPCHTALLRGYRAFTPKSVN